jgi:hypothetical protein
MHDELLYSAAVPRTLVPKWSPIPRGSQPIMIDSGHTESPLTWRFVPASAGLVLVGTTGFEPATP